MKFNKTLTNILLSGVLAMLSTSALASGFALIEQSGSGMGNAYAGGAAAAEDASTIFFNPAGMTRLKGNQLVFAGHAIKPTGELSNTGTQAAALQTLGGTGGDAGDWAFIPNAYATMEAGENIFLGLALNAPFGLQTEYDSTWMGRFQAVKSRIETINFNPSVAIKLDETLSVGFGVNYQRLKGTLTSAVNYSALTAGAAGLNNEGLSVIKGSDRALGYNFGVLFEPTKQTRMGFSYRTGIDFNLQGDVNFTNRPATLTAGQASVVRDGAVSLEIETPSIMSISVFHQLNSKWDMMADVSRTGWSSLQKLDILRDNGTNLTPTVRENWSNTWRASLGVNHHYNDKLTLRGGTAYDQSPVPDGFRTARIPDSNRVWIAAGAQYKLTNTSVVDVGYAHLFMRESTIADNQTARGSGNLVGTYNNSVDVISMQYAYSF